MIVIVGGLKGGTGKSTLATNLAALRALSGKEVLMIECGFGKGSCCILGRKLETKLELDRGFPASKNVEGEFTMKSRKWQASLIASLLTLEVEIVPNNAQLS